jgi:hypothetical protein
MSQKNTRSKPKYRVVGVPSTKDIRRHAATLQKTLNDMMDDGYTFQIIQDRNGRLVIGERLELPPELEAMLGATAPSEPEIGTPPLSERSAEIFALLANTPAPARRTRLAMIAKQFDNKELLETAAEFEASAASHACASGQPCSTASFLRASALVLREQAQARN